MRFPSDFKGYGTGVFIQGLPQTSEHTFRDFSGGYVSVATKESAPLNSSPNAPDTEVDNKGRIVRAPGTTLIEDLGVNRTPIRMAVHASLDFTAELILFDPPFLGVRGPTSTVWQNRSLHTGVIAYTNFGGTFVFTDGRTVYARQANDGTTLTILSEAPVARTYASWANRLWAGMAVIGGNYEPQGLMWSAANSDYRDWTGTGSGFELLINDLAMGDQIQALIPMGLDFMAVMLRSSIWIGTRTRVADRPGDFRVRQPRTGAINGRVCQATRRGILYLNDSGVHLFNGNESVHVSSQIDGDILPLDETLLQLYTSAFDPRTDKYLLHIPDGNTYIFDLKHGRWSHRTLSVHDSAIWYEQLSPTTWGDLVGDWASQASFSWHDYAATSDQINLVFLGDEAGGNRAISREDASSLTYFNSTVQPSWEFPAIPGAGMHQLLTLDQINIKYDSQGTLEFWAINESGEQAQVGLYVLPNEANMTVRSLTDQRLGLPIGLMLRWGAASTVRIGSAQVIYTPAGPVINAELI